MNSKRLTVRSCKAYCQNQGGIYGRGWVTIPVLGLFPLQMPETQLKVAKAKRYFVVLVCKKSMKNPGFGTGWMYKFRY